jgi:hypothetical protein
MGIAAFHTMKQLAIVLDSHIALKAIVCGILCNLQERTLIKAGVADCSILVLGVEKDTTMEDIVLE